MAVGKRRLFFLRERERERDVSYDTFTQVRAQDFEGKIRINDKPIIYPLFQIRWAFPGSFMVHGFQITDQHNNEKKRDYGQDYGIKIKLNYRQKLPR